ncbi:MAG TPA: SurA N-terminal domain-containing protein [Patescibacteria group bacterium]|nr:SurA N-terminal domain-containing protein [Patescibacteria group bacterium]
MPTAKRKTTAKKTTKRKPLTPTISQNKLHSVDMKNAKQVNSQVVTLYVKNPRLWVGVSVVVVVLALFFFKGLFIAATVNGQPISRLAVVSQLEKQGGKQALDNLIVENLIRQEAQKRHVSVSQTDIDGQIKKIEDQLKGQGMTLDNALAAQGLTKSDLVDQLTIQALLTKMIGNSVSVSDADIEKYIAANQDNLPKDLSDADLKSQVKSQLEQQQLQTKTQAFVATLQKNAKITYFVGY